MVLRPANGRPYFSHSFLLTIAHPNRYDGSAGTSDDSGSPDDRGNHDLHFRLTTIAPTGAR